MNKGTSCLAPPQYESLGWWRAGAELRKIHFAEEWNEVSDLRRAAVAGSEEGAAAGHCTRHTGGTRRRRTTPRFLSAAGPAAASWAALQKLTNSPLLRPLPCLSPLQLHHLQIMETLGGDQLWVDRFAALHAAIVYYWILIGLYIFSPKLAYNFSELIEYHAVDTYGAWP